MKTIISDDAIVSLFHKSDATVKNILKEVLGADSFKINFGEQIKTFDDGLRFKSLTTADVLPSVPSFMKEHEERIHAVSKLIFLSDIYRDGWIPDWSNSDQQKWYPWFRYSSGSGLSLGAVACGRSYAHVDARLTFPTEELATTFERNFRPIYNSFLL